MVRRILQVALLVLVALILSTLSMFIKMGVDTTASENIGIISQWGFPIHYRITAPGLAWAQFDALRFFLNVLVWFTVLISSLITVIFRKTR